MGCAEEGHFLMCRKCEHLKSDLIKKYWCKKCKKVVQRSAMESSQIKFRACGSVYFAHSFCGEGELISCTSPKFENNCPCETAWITVDEYNNNKQHIKAKKE